MKLLLCDYDGTLGDTLKIMHEANTAVFEAHIDAPPPQSFAEYCANVSSPYLTFYQRFVPGLTQKSLNDAFFGSPAHARYDEHLLIDGISEMLHQLRQRDVFLGIVSAMEPIKLDATLDRLGIIDFFPYICAGQYDKESAIIRGMEYFDCTRVETAYIGDIKSDILAANRAGVISIGALFEPCETHKMIMRDVLTAVEADHCVDHPREILSLF